MKVLLESHLLEHGCVEPQEKGVLYETPNQPVVLNSVFKPFVQMLGYRYGGQGQFERMFTVPTTMEYSAISSLAAVRPFLHWFPIAPEPRPHLAYDVGPWLLVGAQADR